MIVGVAQTAPLVVESLRNAVLVGLQIVVTVAACAVVAAGLYAVIYAFAVPSTLHEFPVFFDYAGCVRCPCLRANFVCAGVSVCAYVVCVFVCVCE